MDANHANLLVTYEPSHRVGAERTVRALIGKDARLLVSDVEGVFLLHAHDPRRLVRRLREEAEEDVSRFTNVSSWVPIDEWHAADVVELQRALRKIDERIDPAKSWKLEVRKRLFDMSTSELIAKLTEPLTRQKVDLRFPEQIVRVEIVKDRAGIALLAPDEILNVQELRKE